MLKVKAPIRGDDIHGNGAYQAPRGNRKHRGIDVACYKGSAVLAATAGKVTKIGRPYYKENPQTEKDRKKNALRYVQVTDADGYDVRYFYIAPCVSIGDRVGVDKPLGITQGLESIYKGITDHYHFEVKKDGHYVDPVWYITQKAYM